MTTTTDVEFDQSFMLSVEAARTVAWRHTGEEPRERARAIVLAIPYMRWQSPPDTDARLKVYLDYLAALEFAGYHGHDPWLIEERASFISTCWDEEIQAETRLLKNAAGRV